MAKRRSIRQLNKDDPDEIDDDPEDSGQFEAADSGSLAKRKIVTAKRRIQGESGGPSPFTNFAGFSLSTSGANFQFSKKQEETIPKIDKPEEKTDQEKPVPAKSGVNSEDLKTLNFAFLQWVKDSLDKDPLVSLAPIFKDYEKHLATLLPASSSITTTKPSIVPSFPPFVYKKPDEPKLTFGIDNSKEKSEKAPENDPKKEPVAASLPFSFGLNTVPAKPADPKPSTEISNPPTFNFTTTTPAFGSSMSFNFNSTPFGSNNGTAPPAPATANNEEDTDEPPVSDYVPVGEEGSVFDTRCKLFAKKDGQFSSIGVGKLHLKPLTGGKTQVIARADTAQGNVLLNVILTGDMPLQKTGKNNVLLVCVPTPDAKPPPVPILIRVKGAEERDQLFTEMEKLRG